MKRTTIEFMIGWLDALRRDDVEALKATLAPDVVWGNRPVRLLIDPRTSST